MTQPLEPRSRVGVIFDAVSIAVFVAGWCALLIALVSAAGPLQTGWLLLLLALPGLLVAELGAGIFHWFADTFFTPSAPWIGRASWSRRTGWSPPTCSCTPGS